VLQDIIIGVVFLIVGAVLGAALPEYLKRPKILISGSGTGTVGSHRIATISISNPPCFFGVNLGETIMFGK
jgi:hypothetical protein